MTTTQDKAIADLLKKLHDAHWTDNALGTELGVTGQTIYRWRHGKSPAQLPKLVRGKLLDILAQTK